MQKQTESDENETKGTKGTNEQLKHNAKNYKKKATSAYKIKTCTNKAIR